MPIPLMGERVILRKFKPSDADDVFFYASDPEVTRYAEWQPHRTPLDSIAYIRRCLKNGPDLFTLAVELRAIGRVIGSVDLRLVSRIRRIGEIGYTIARPYWGLGFNVEAGNLLLDFAFRELGLRRVVALCDINNRRSFRTAEKLGMVRERVVNCIAQPESTLRECYQYGLLRSEWERREPAPSSRRELIRSVSFRRYLIVPERSALWKQIAPRAARPSC